MLWRRWPPLALAVLITGILPTTAAVASSSLPVPPGVPAIPPVAFDCSTDVTDAFNSWLANVPDGAVIALVPGGCYRSNGTILFNDKRNITVLGNGATIKASGAPACPPSTASNGNGYCVVPKNPDGRCPTGAVHITATGECAWPVNRAQLWFDRGGGLTVRDLTLQGSNFTPDCAESNPARSCYDSAREADGNLYVRGSDGILVDNVHLKNAWGDAVQASPGGSWDAEGRGAVMARNVTVRDSTVDTVGRMAFSCSGCANMAVTDSTITNVGYWVVDVEVEAKTWSGDMTLERNTYSNVYLGLIAVTPNLAPSTLGPIVVRDNVGTDAPPTCTNAMRIGLPNMPRSSSVIVNGNRLYGGAEGIRVSAAHAEVTRNTVDFPRLGCGGYTGVVFDGVPSGSIIGNTVLNATRLYEPVSSTATVCGNRTTASGPFDQPVPC